MSKISVIGAGGKVGVAISYALVSRNIPTELILVDINEDKAKGEVEDLRHCAAFTNNMEIAYGTAEDTKNSDIIIVSAGAPQGANITRLTPLKKNVSIYKSIIPELAEKSPNAIFLIVTNPVDILTELTIELTGFPKERVIGSGTLLDSSRLRYYLGKKIGVFPQDINAYVFGEHGDSGFVAWSMINVAGIRLKDYLEINGISLTAKDKAEIEDRIKKVAFEIVAKKGGTDLAIGLSCATISDCILKDRKVALTVSSQIDGVYGYSDICVAIPTIIGREGIIKHLVPALTEDELGKFKDTCQVIKEYSDIMHDELNNLNNN